MGFRRALWVNLYLFCVLFSIVSCGIASKRDVKLESESNSTENVLATTTLATNKTTNESIESNESHAEDELTESVLDHATSIESDQFAAESRGVKTNIAQPPMQYYKNYQYFVPYYNRQFRASRSYDEQSDLDLDDEFSEELDSNEQMVGMMHSAYPEPSYAIPHQTCGGHFVIGCQPVVRPVPCSAYQQPAYGQPIYSVPAPAYGSPSPSHYLSSPHETTATQSSYRENHENKTESAKDSSTPKSQ